MSFLCHEKKNFWNQFRFESFQFSGAWLSLDWVADQKISKVVNFNFLALEKNLPRKEGQLLGSFGDFYALPFPVKVVIFNVYKAE